MRSRRPSPEHEQAVARRLALLSAELAAVRRETGDDGPIGHDEATGGRPVQPGDDGAWPWEEHTRIRGSEGSYDPGSVTNPSEEVLAPVEIPGWTLPVPGRHAARRELLVSLVPTGLRGRVGLQPLHLALVAVMVAIAVGVAPRAKLE